jgi:hypothetical protein
MAEATFTRGPARRPAPVVRDPLLQWANGLPTKDRKIYSGWLCETNRDEELDAAMKKAGYEQVTVKHGSGNLVTHWGIAIANLFVIAEGLQSIPEMGQTEQRYGVAFGWRQLETRRQSQLRFRAFLHDLLQVGYLEPLIVTMSGTITGDMLKALNEQFRVIDAIESFRKANGKPKADTPFYVCSIPVQAGQETVRARRQPAGKPVAAQSEGREIAPPIARVPDTVTQQYIEAHWCKRAWIPLIEDRLDDTIAWSIATSRMIGQGLEEKAEEPPPEEEPGEFD